MKQYSAKEKERLCLENGTSILWSSMIRYSLIPIALINERKVEGPDTGPFSVAFNSQMEADMAECEPLID
ncbi:hypothetical protein NGI46_24820 [Peribacillus butanolivorans]|uniref:hypothetical protein n=1 Tax=Peribacillus butanolivorans TaxID=421767 RepID=UPI00207CB778|nr:hypothetical protein [Peribacillus butanolivorans]MCO0600570.1 hypothetical protein [Peribacillus butanolivorans]